MLIEEQDEVLAMLEKLRDIKRYIYILILEGRLQISGAKKHASVQLEKFSARQLSTVGPEIQTRMEIDSTASSPHD